jgi:DNA-binding response OmpR family regulator
MISMKLNVREFFLVDDDEDDTSLFLEALAHVDASVVCHTADDCKQALRLLGAENKTPELIFLDINMPGMSGWQCLMKLKEDARHREIPVIMYSTSSHERDIGIALDLGALCFFVKPNDFKTLRNILQVIVSHPISQLPAVISHFRNIRTIN